MNIIYEIIKLIQDDKWYGVSNQIEISKGKYKLFNFSKKVKRYIFKFLIKIKTNNG